MSVVIRNRYTNEVLATVDRLEGADLRGANLRGAHLRGADLGCAHLRGADLGCANLLGAHLLGANLGCANLGCANLRGADLRGANLRGADLRGADLRGADLRCADLGGADLLGAKGTKQTYVAPECGSFTAWKKCRNGVIVKLCIPAKAKRSNATGRKCRAEFARVVRVYGADYGVSDHDGITEYRVGEVVRCHNWEPNRWIECAGGIHFFMTREEAEDYPI